MKVIAYCRVSTDDQANDRQITDIRTRCKLLNYTIIEEFLDTGSGKIKERPVLTAMMNFVKDPSNEVDCVMISETSRLGRTSFVLQTIEELTKMKVGLYSMKEELRTLNEDKTENFTAKMTLSILSSINSYELETMKYRTKSGTKDKIAKYQVTGNNNLPYGYCKENKETKLLKIDPEEKEVVKTIFKLYLEDNGTTKIARYLNENNIPTKTKIVYEKEKYSPWVQGTVYKILQNPIYIGIRKHQTKPILTGNKKSEDGKFKRKFEYEDILLPDLRIIKDDTFNKVQLLLKDRGPKVAFRKYNYLLDSDKVKCGICGKTYFKYRKVKTNEHRYSCASKREFNNCGNAGISINKLEVFIQNVILHRQKDLLKEQLDNKELKNEIHILKNDVDQLNKELQKELNNELNIIRKNNNGLLDDEAYSILYKEIKNNKNTIVSKTNVIQEQINELTKQQIESTDIKKIQYDFNKLGKKLPTKVVNSIISKIIVTKIEATEPIFQQIVKEMLNKSDDLFKNKQDNLLLIKIVSDDRNLYYIISQREDAVFDIQDNTFRFTKLSMGFSTAEIFIPITELPRRYYYNK